MDFVWKPGFAIAVVLTFIVILQINVFGVCGSKSAAEVGR